MQQLRGVHVLERLQQLVHDVRLVDLFQDVRPNHRMQVCLHVLEHQVDVAVILRLQHVQDPAAGGFNLKLICLAFLFCPGIVLQVGRWREEVSRMMQSQGYSVCDMDSSKCKTYHCANFHGAGF